MILKNAASIQNLLFIDCIDIRSVIGILIIDGFENITYLTQALFYYQRYEMARTEQRSALIAQNITQLASFVQEQVELQDIFIHDIESRMSELEHQASGEETSQHIEKNEKSMFGLRATLGDAQEISRKNLEKLRARDSNLSMDIDFSIGQYHRNRAVVSMLMMVASEYGRAFI